MHCPICGSRKTGRIGRDRYYCAECCHEWLGTTEVKVFRILSDGTVASLKNGQEIGTGRPGNAHRQAG